MVLTHICIRIQSRNFGLPNDGFFAHRCPSCWVLKKPKTSTVLGKSLLEMLLPFYPLRCPENGASLPATLSGFPQGLISYNHLKSSIGLISHTIIQWEIQDPKMEVLYHIKPYFVGIFPYIGLT